MGFLFSPERKAAGPGAHAGHHERNQARLERSVPFAMEPVVYDFAINEHGTQAALLRGDDALMPPATTRCRFLRWSAPKRRRLSPRAPRRAGALHRGMPLQRRITPAWSNTLFDHMLPAGQRCGRGPGANARRTLLDDYGFDRVQHEQIRAGSALRPHRPGAEPPAGSPASIEDAEAVHARRSASRAAGLEALAAGRAWPWFRWPAAWAPAGRAAPAW